MSMAEVKAKLAAAYSAGEKPQFVSVFPTGRDEVWRMGDTMLVVPVVPADAPASLEYALRLRRDTYMTGSCENCAATFDIDSEQEVDSIAVIGLYFPHRVTCPARDSSTKKLLDEYYDTRLSLGAKQQLEIASGAARDRVRAQAAINGTRVSGEFAEAKAEQLIDKLMIPPVSMCPHLQVAATQVWSTFIAKADWQCDQCWAYTTASIKANGPLFDSLEEFTCDLCRRYSPISIEPLVIRYGAFIMVGGACKRCNTEYSAFAVSESVSAVKGGM